MNDDETNESNAGGEEDNNDVTPSEKLKAENDEMEKELTRKEKLRAKIMLGGKSDAGKESVKKETNADYAKKVMSGEFNGPKEA